MTNSLTNTTKCPDCGTVGIALKISKTGMLTVSCPSCWKQWKIESQHCPICYKSNGSTLREPCKRCRNKEARAHA